jgi:hypothetical protein
MPPLRQAAGTLAAMRRERCEKVERSERKVQLESAMKDVERIENKVQLEIKMKK